MHNSKDYALTKKPHLKNECPLCVDENEKKVKRKQIAIVFLRFYVKCYKKPNFD